MKCKAVAYFATARALADCEVASCRNDADTDTHVRERKREREKEKERERERE